MNIQDAIDVIESVSGFTDESTPVGEAWKEVLSYLYRHPAKPEERLAPRVLAMCKLRNWSLHWTARGAYLHLEASELIEALRGKRGDPTAEAADVLIVLMSITENAGIAWSDVLRQAESTCSRLETCDQYPGEERMDNPTQPVVKDANSNKCTTEQQSWECPNMFETGSDFYCVYYSCNICNRTKTLYYDNMK
jgi:hypothetical protein